jgi:hypothetical protein
MSLPGDWLYETSRRFLDAATVESLVAPTIADLQYEVSHAGHCAWRVVLAHLRGHCAFMRLLFVHGIIWRFPMRRLITVLVLAGVGSALLMEIVSVASGPEVMSAYFLMAVLTPIALRFLTAGNSFPEMFVNCMGVGMMMGTVHLGSVFLSGAPFPRPWYAFILSVSVMTGCIALGSALAASVASKPTTGSRPAYRRSMLQIVAASATFVACYSVIALWFAYARGSYRVFDTLSWATFLGFFFAAVSVAVYLPVLLGVGRVIRNQRARLLLAVFGAALFPVPLLSFPLLQGRFGSTWLFLLGHPQTLLLTSLPYVLAGALLGWLLAEHSRPVEGATA